MQRNVNPVFLLAFLREFSNKEAERGRAVMVFDKPPGNVKFSNNVPMRTSGTAPGPMAPADPVLDRMAAHHAATPSQHDRAEAIVQQVVGGWRGGDNDEHTTPKEGSQEQPATGKHAPLRGCTAKALQKLSQ